MHRWYDPHSGRWISEDPIGFAAGDANLYRYVGNEVTGARDPSGLQILPFDRPPYQPTYSDNTIASKIIDRLILHFVTGAISFSLLNRGWKLFIDTYSMSDDLGEMKKEFDASMQAHYRDIALMRYQKNELGYEWRKFSVDTPNVKGTWAFGNQPRLETGWWLNGAHGVDASVDFEARCVGDRVQVRRIEAAWKWRDEIDAAGVKQWWREKDNWSEVISGIPNLFIEALWWDKVMDGIVDVDYKVEINWRDKAKDFSFGLDPTQLRETD